MVLGPYQYKVLDSCHWYTRSSYRAYSFFYFQLLTIIWQGRRIRNIHGDYIPYSHIINVLPSHRSHETCSPPEGAKGNLTKNASLHSRLPSGCKHSAQPTSAGEATRYLWDFVRSVWKSVICTRMFQGKRIIKFCEFLSGWPLIICALQAKRVAYKFAAFLRTSFGNVFAGRRERQLPPETTLGS